MASDYWARPAIEYLSTLGLMDGFSAYFKPEKPVTREELAVILVKAKQLEFKIVNSSPFHDVNYGRWSVSYINKVVEKGYLEPSKERYFYPYKKVTRAEGIRALSKFAGLIIPEKVAKSPYQDIDKSGFYAKYVYAAKLAGLLEFIGGDNFLPNKFITRAEIAEIISKTKFGRDKIREFLTKS